MEIVTVDVVDRVASVRMDDGKVNAISPLMIDALNAALDTAESDADAIILSGRDGVFSAGFDLKVMQSGGPEAIHMLRGGFHLAHRLLDYPKPVVAATTGHAIAMGLFLLLSADHRIGPDGTEHRFVANEVEIGLTVPFAAVEIMRHRMAPAAFDLAVGLSHPFSTETAVAAGILHETAKVDTVHEVAMAAARRAAGLPATPHAASKQRARTHLLDAILTGVETEFPAM